MVKNHSICEDLNKFRFEVSSQALASAQNPGYSTWYHSLFTKIYLLLSYLPKLPGF